MLILSSIAIRRTYLRYEASFRRRMRFGRFTWRHYLIFKYAYLIVICILNSDVGEKEKERERAVTEMRHIIAVRGTLSWHLTECKCTSGISRFNHERVYTFVLLYWLRYITLRDVFSGPSDRRWFTFLFTMFKNKWEMCIS